MRCNEIKGIIVKGVKNFFDVFIESGEFAGQIIRCNSKGIFRFERDSIRPLVGDSVDISLTKDINDITEVAINEENKDEALGRIEKIHERKNFLSRPPIANLDVLFIVSAVKSPAPAYFFIDKLTAGAIYNYIEPIIIANKIDLLAPDENCDIYDIYTKADIKTIKLSATVDIAENDAGFEELKQEMCGKICAFTGVSGAGKSSILNKLLNMNLETGVLSEKIERGKHTTRTVELFRHDWDGFAADTPGFSALDFSYVDIKDRGIKESTREILKEELISVFPDLQEFAYDCKYRRCTHLKEDGCKVIEAVTLGLASKSRHDSYSELYEQQRNKKD